MKEMQKFPEGNDQKIALAEFFEKVESIPGVTFLDGPYYTYYSLGDELDLSQFRALLEQYIEESGLPRTILTDGMNLFQFRGEIYLLVPNDKNDSFYRIGNTHSSLLTASEIASIGEGNMTRVIGKSVEAVQRLLQKGELEASKIEELRRGVQPFVLLKMSYL